MIPTKSHCSQWLFVYDGAVAQQLGLVVVLCRPAVEALHLAKVMVQALTAMAQQLGLVVSVATTKKATLNLLVASGLVGVLLGCVVQKKVPATKTIFLLAVGVFRLTPWALSD